MPFLNPYFLFALLGAAVPIALHLLTRDRIQYVPFSTLRFFAKGAKLVVRRKKFEEMILLLMRVLLAALLAIVFARPFFGSKSAADAGQTQFATARVVVVDVSGSMRRPGLADALKKEASGAIDSLREGSDAGAIITFADTPTVLSPMSDKLAPAKTAAAALTPGYGGTNIAKALRKANELLRGTHAKQKEIVLISDLQRGGWSYFKGDWKLSSDVKLNVDAVKPSGPGHGYGIIDMSAPTSLVLDKQPSFISVRVANYTDQPVANLPVSLVLNGQKTDTQQINIRPNGKVAVRFRHVFDTAGDNPGSVVVGPDASTPDNTVYFNARTVPRIPVLVINGRPSSNPQSDTAYFLDKALAPSDDSPFAVTTKAANQVTPQDIAASKVVVLANVGSVAAPVSDALAAMVNGGGGIFFLPGDQVKAESFNSEFGKIAPAQLRQVLQAHPTNGDTAESLTRIDFNHPVFDVFAQPHHGDLSLPKFAKYWETTDTQLSRVLARFGDGRPAILERDTGKGLSMALVSAVDGDWNDFAHQSVFLPFVHQVVRHLAVQTGQPTVFASGDLLPVPEGDTATGPQGAALAPTAGKPQFYADQPGFYYAVNKQGGKDFCYAVNGSAAESDPNAIGGDEIVSAIERAPNEISGGLDADTTSPSEGGKSSAGLWWYLLAATIALCMAELVIGNKTIRH